MGFPKCLPDCSICANADISCLAGNGDDNYRPATKEQVIDRLNSSEYNSRSIEMMIKFLKDKYNYDYNGPDDTHHTETDVEDKADASKNNCELIRYSTEEESKEHMYKDLNDLKKYGNGQASSTISMALVAVNEDFSKAVLLSDVPVIPPEEYPTTDAMFNDYDKSLAILRNDARELLYNTFTLNSRNPEMVREIRIALRGSGLEGGQLQAAEDAMYKYIKSKYVNRYELKLNGGKLDE